MCVSEVIQKFTIITIFKITLFNFLTVTSEDTSRHLESNICGHFCCLPGDNILQKLFTKG